MYSVRGKLIAANAQAAKVYGVSSVDELLQEVKTVFDFLTEDGKSVAEASFSRTLSKGQSQKNEYLVRKRNGTLIPTEINSSVVRTATGEPRAFISVIRDSTKGMGLGLAICYSVVKRHDGLITVVSEPGSGTSFTVYLPAAVSKRTMEVVAEGDTTGKDILEGTTVFKGSILIMDDEAIIRDLMKEVLNQLGYDVKVASDGAEAIAE